MILLSLFDAAAFFQWFVDNANYLFVFLFMMVESSFVPFPSEVVVPPAAYLACANTGAGASMSLIGVILVATLGALCGAYINYYISLWVGRPVIYRFADSKLGHACLIDREKVLKAEAYFDRHGSISTFLGRLIPAIRQLISIPAGLARMNIWKFSLFTFLGAGVWNTVLALLGAWLASNVSPDHLFEKVEEYNRYLTWGGYALLLLIVAYLIFSAFRHKSVKPDQTE